MRQQLQPGQCVTVNAFGGKQPSVIVVEDRGDVVLICKPDEFKQAKAEKREPVAVGFHREDVIEPASTATKKGVASEVDAGHPRSMVGD